MTSGKSRSPSSSTTIPCLFSSGEIFFDVVLLFNKNLSNVGCFLSMSYYFSDMGHHIVMEYVHCSICNHCVLVISYCKLCRAIHFEVTSLFRAVETSSLSSSSFSFSSMLLVKKIPFHFEGVSVLL